MARKKKLQEPDPIVPTKQIRDIDFEDSNNIKGLKRAYDIAVISKQEIFEFQDAEFDIEYAAYLLEFYSNKLKK